MQVNGGLTSLDLIETYIGDVGAAAICEALKVNLLLQFGTSKIIAGESHTDQPRPEQQ